MITRFFGDVVSVDAQSWAMQWPCKLCGFHAYWRFMVLEWDDCDCPDCPGHETESVRFICATCNPKPDVNVAE